MTAVLAQRKEPFHDHICFHCQQSAEKYLKALLEELGIDVEKTHELKNLQALLLPHHPQLRALRRGLEFQRLGHEAADSPPEAVVVSR